MWQKRCPFPVLKSWGCGPSLHCFGKKNCRCPFLSFLPLADCCALLCLGETPCSAPFLLTQTPLHWPSGPLFSVLLNQSSQPPVDSEAKGANKTKLQQSVGCCGFPSSTSLSSTHCQPQSGGTPITCCVWETVLGLRAVWSFCNSGAFILRGALDLGNNTGF